MPASAAATADSFNTDASPVGDGGGSMSTSESESQSQSQSQSTMDDHDHDHDLTIEAIDARRKDMDISQGDLADRLAASDGYDLAGSTLSGRITEWKDDEHDREPEPSDLQRLASILDAIEEKRNTTYPNCTRCGRECIHPPDTIDGDPYCIVCGDWLGVRDGVAKDAV